MIPNDCEKNIRLRSSRIFFFALSLSLSMNRSNSRIDIEKTIRSLPLTPPRSYILWADDANEVKTNRSERIRFLLLLFSFFFPLFFFFFIEFALPYVFSTDAGKSSDGVLCHDLRNVDLDLLN